MPKLVASADWHITDRTPRSRKDNYPETQFKKIQWILDFARSHQADIAVAGDIFDAPTCSFTLFNKYLNMFLEYPFSIRICAGQHDIHNHDLSTIKDTPLGSLLYAGAVTYGDGNQIECVSWEDTPEEIGNVLVMHKGVTPEEPPFFMRDAVSIAQTFKLWPSYRCRIFGDYHTPSLRIDPMRGISLNCGSLMRMNKEQIEYKPSVWLIDTDNWIVEEVPIPIEPTDQVFDLVKLQRAEQNKEKVEIETGKLARLLGKHNNQVDFKDVVDAICKEMKVDEDVIEVLDEFWKNTH